MDLRTFQIPPELFTLTPVGSIEKCLVGYVVSVTAGIVNSNNAFVSLLFHMKRVTSVSSSNHVPLFEPVFADGDC